MFSRIKHMRIGFCFGILLFFSLFVASEQNSTTTTWIRPQTDILSLSFLPQSRCVNSAGLATDINVTVRDSTDNSLVTTATVTATVIKPNSDTNSATFSSNNDGNYSLKYTFDQNGTYKFIVHAVNGIYTGDANSFEYAGNVSVSISFQNNGQTLTAGNTGQIRNLVTASDGNFFLGATGTTTINYPSGSAFASSVSMNESGNGEYYYNFTVPSTAGTYTAASAFSCGVNSGTSSSGSFIVSGSTTPSSPGGDTGSGSGGSGGGGSSGGGGERISSEVIESKIESCDASMDALLAKLPELFADKAERENFLRAASVFSCERKMEVVKITNSVIKSTAYDTVYSIAFTNNSVNSWSNVAIIETIPPIVATSGPGIESGTKFKAISTNPLVLEFFFEGEIRPLETKIISYKVNKRLPADSLAGFSAALFGGVRGEKTRLGPDAKILGWKMTGDFEGQYPKPSKDEATIVAVIQNTGTGSGDFLLAATIFMGRDVEYFEETAIKDLAVGEKRDVSFEKKWLPRLAGTNRVLLEIFSPDKKTKFGELVDSFDLGGQFTYDVKVQCSETSINSGNDIGANIELLNLGDYFEDIDVSWWVEDQSGKQVGLSSIPLALFPREPKQILQKIYVPQDWQSGSYTFKAQVEYGGKKKQGSCSFTVESANPNYLLLLLIILIIVAMIAGYAKKEDIFGLKEKEPKHSKFKSNKLNKLLGLE